jgi:alkylhydroperoxidase/carboxymuconolactone decarboxylase family protein YurZ
MERHPLWVIQENDAELFKALTDTSKMALAEGALPAKVKYLIAMALDASHGAANGVRYLAQQALASGATKAEIMEAVRVVYSVSGSGSVYTAAAGLEGVFGNNKPL